MKYAILVHETEDEFAAREDAGRAEGYWAAWAAYGKALREAGVLEGGAGLMPPRDATTLRLRGGKRQVQDGPYADTKERFGGFYMIEVADLDKALEWAARCPAASTGSVEVRPVLPPMR
jgi:hypothetical protein